MNQTIKNILGIAIAFSVLLFVFAIINFSIYYSKSIQPSSFRNFSVTGEGKEVAIPDVAEFTFDIITEGGKDIAGLQTENTDKTNKVIDFIKNQGIDSKDMKTQNYNLSPRYQNYKCYPLGVAQPNSLPIPQPCPPAVIIGYTITQTVQVKIRDFSKIGDILSGVIQNGANSVSELSFTIDDPTAIQDKARTEAIKNAKEKAESISQAAGFKLGRLLSIQEVGNPVPQPYFEALGMGTAQSVKTSTPTIEPGSQEITSDITLEYEIE